MATITLIWDGVFDTTPESSTDYYRGSTSGYFNPSSYTESWTGSNFFYSGAYPTSGFINTYNYYQKDGSFDWKISATTYFIYPGETYDEIISGLVKGEDSWYGNDFDNTFFISVGGDRYYGGNGIDTLNAYLTKENWIFSETSIGKSGDVVTINNFGLTSITLDSVERIQFADATLAFDTDAANSAGGIYRLYMAALDRTPDLSGLGYWIAQADAGTKDAVRMATDFTYATEFKTLYGVQTADNYITGEDITALVTKIYENVLDRAPDAGGRDYYVGQITAKSKTVGQVLAEISDSTENKLAVVELIATGIEYTPWVD